MAKDGIDFEAPYPLQLRFRKLILPGLLFLTLVIAFIMGNGSSWLTEKIYLEISENRAGVINRALLDEDRGAWEALQVSTNPKTVFQTSEGLQLLENLRSEVKELGLSHLKVYGPGGLLLYSSLEKEIGDYDPSPGFENALNGERTLVEKKQPDGTRLYELYVKVPGISNPVVMELYEPVDYLNAITLQAILPATLVPVLVLIFLGLVMNTLVRRAQRDINYRNTLLIEFRERLQKLVSNEAVATLRSSTGKGEIASRRLKATVLFSDVRGFTDFCENETPENVVAFLNQSLGIVIDAVRHHHGDVDKMIGDAVLAYFQGEEAEKNALAAAREAMAAMKHANLPRDIGIGIYSGDVVVGTVGAANRMDFTLIGDTVNVASRLCSAAKAGEIVVDSDSMGRTEAPTTHHSEELMVKGREKPLKIYRLTV